MEGLRAGHSERAASAARSANELAALEIVRVLFALRLLH
jgi:hypothetical protein